jgi:pilus assembly protein Flp/PilA
MLPFPAVKPANSPVQGNGELVSRLSIFLNPRESMTHLYREGIAAMRRKEQGVSSIEYALLGALIAVVCALTVTAVGANTALLYTFVCNQVAAAIGGPAC